MSEISTALIEEAVYKLCFDANTCLNKRIYDKILEVYASKTCVCKDIVSDILKNAKIAYEKKVPLCQDTGIVIVFIEIGQEVKITGGLLDDVINSAVEKCYKENFFRKSIVQNAIFNRNNTKTNTPVIIHTKIIRGQEIKITVLIKGAGSENKTKLKMMLPTSSEEDIIKTCSEIVISAGENTCPPLFIGIGIGSSSENALIMSKKALFEDEFSLEELSLSEKIKEYINSHSPEKYGKNYVSEVNLKTSSTHIACMPVAVTLNCHSDRFSKCTINRDGIKYEHQFPDFIEISGTNEKLREVYSEDTETLRNLKAGEKILLTGEIYAARDMAHKRMFEMISRGEEIPLQIKDKIIFYAGPCPNKPGEIIGPIGPTTAGRMDKYAIEFYKLGLLASIGKGGRNKDVEKIIKEKHAKYFTVCGGIAALLAEKVKKSEIIAFDDLGTEAVYKLAVEKFPLTVEI